MSDPQHLIVIVRAPLQLQLRSGALSDELTFENRTYRDSGLGDWIGFYDWLRKDDGEIVGVRSWIEVADLKAMHEAVRSHQSIQACPDQIRIFFSADRNFVAGISADQELADHSVFHSEGEYAFVYGVQGLTPRELTGLVMLCQRAN